MDGLREPDEIDGRPYNGRYGQGPALARPKLLVPAVLFIATVATTITAGAMFIEGADIFNHPLSLLTGVPFSASLLFILGSHELAHFVASRRHGVETTLPMFIPGPPLPPMPGTFGAIIRIKSPITTKNALVDIGAAGPLAGFVVALVVTTWGLALSRVIVRIPTGTTLGLGDSLIFKLLSYIVLGPIPHGYDILLHPVAYAGWLGMFITAMNLLPLGQLDGGHIIYALIGPRHKIFSRLMVALLVVLGIVSWTGWFIWAILIVIMGMWHPPVEDHYVAMDPKRRLVSAAALLVFVLTFIPEPFYIM